MARITADRGYDDWRHQSPPSHQRAACCNCTASNPTLIGAIELVRTTKRIGRFERNHLARRDANVSNATAVVLATTAKNTKVFNASIDYDNQKTPTLQYFRHSMMQLAKQNRNQSSVHDNNV